LSESSRAAPVLSGRDMRACRLAHTGGNELFITATSLEICQRDQASSLRVVAANIVARGACNMASAT
jgi:hypothetical protein